MTRQDILDNPAALAPAQLAAEVRAGTVSLFELVKTGKLDADARRALKEALDRPAGTDPAQIAATSPAHTSVSGNAPAHTYHHTRDASNKKVSWKGASPAPAPVLTPAPAPEDPREVYIPPKPPMKNRPMFRHFFTPYGRITRTENGFTLLFIVVYYIAMLLWSVEMPRYEETAAVCFFSVMFCYIYIIIVAGIKRCHDLGHSGWWMLIPFYFLWMFFKRGSDGTNRYGLTPNRIQK